MNSHHPTFPAEAARLYAHHQAEPSYWPDIASEIDTPEEILADQFNIPPLVARRLISHIEDQSRKNQALVLGKVIGLLLETTNLPVMIHALAFAAGLDQLNGARSQAEVARQLGVTRALMSHYVVGVRDVLSGRAVSFDCLKFRKAQKTRATFKDRATNPFTAAKKAAIRKHHTANKSHA